ncbi:hypothetical protein FHS08_000603 [Microbacterium ulmi]|nr:hypothetical protein [Microbacterium ulmi]
MFAASPANAVVVGVCTIKANNPHGSTHVSGTINAEGSLQCTIGMTEIYVRAYLENSVGTSWYGNTESWLATSPNEKFSSFANTSCAMGPGSFRTRVSYAFTSPPGTNPSYTANTIYSPWIGVACGVSRSAGPTTPTGVWTSEQPLPKGITLTPTADGVEITFSTDEVAR